MQEKSLGPTLSMGSVPTPVSGLGLFAHCRLNTRLNTRLGQPSKLLHHPAVVSASRVDQSLF